MGQELNEKVENILSRIKPGLEGTDVQLKGISGGVVTLDYYHPLSNHSACHVEYWRGLFGRPCPLLQSPTALDQSMEHSI